MKQVVDPFPPPGEHSVRSYIAGFALSVALTISAFAFAWAYNATEHQLFSRGILIGLLALLVAGQIIVQALFFLHVMSARREKLNLHAALFTTMVILIIVIGSLWVMQNLNYRMMPGHDTTHTVEETEGIHR